MDREKTDGIANGICGSRGWGSPQYIDAGASAAVYQISHPHFGQAALKVYDPDFFSGEDAEPQRSRLRLQQQLVGLEHPNLIRFYDAQEAEEEATCFILMEFCAWPSLSKVIPSIPDEKIPSLIGQLAGAVLKLSELGLIHRDIKPDNIIVSPDFETLKLLDLGVVRRISIKEGNNTDINRRKKFLATVQYSPPEYISREEPDGVVGFDALNVYQIGAVLHDLIMKRPIFEEESASMNKYRLFKAVLNKKPSVFSSGVSPRLVSLCRAALDKDPRRRVEAVKVTDFTTPDEGLAPVRRRLGAFRQRAPESRAPSIMIWSAQVRSWITAAARSERDVLGPYQIEELPMSDAAQWRMHFDDLDTSIMVRLAKEPDKDFILLSLSGATGNSPTTPALEIYEAGANVPVDQIIPQLAEQLLIALDHPVEGDAGWESNGE